MALVLSQLEFVPVIVKILIRGRKNPVLTVPGVTFNMQGGFALTVNLFSQRMFVAPVPSVTVTFPVHCGASSAAVMFTVIKVALFTFTLFTVIPVHPNVTLMPLALVKSIFCTDIVTSTVAPASTADGVTFKQPGAGLILVVVVVAILDVVDVVAADVVELVVPPPPP